jgi:hypothetical protein
VLLALELEALRVGEHRVRLDAEQRVVRRVVLAVRVVRVVRGEQRRADLASDLDELRIRVPLRRQAVVLELDEQVVLAEDLLQPAGLREGRLLVALEQRLEDVTAEAARRGDEAVVVLLEQLPVDLRLVVVALEEGEARQLDEVAVPLIGLARASGGSRASCRPRSRRPSRRVDRGVPAARSGTRTPCTPRCR